MARKKLTLIMRDWYLKGTEEDLGNLVLTSERILLARTCLAERIDDKRVILNAFHWPESNDAEAVSVVEAVPWDMLEFVYCGSSASSLEGQRRHRIPAHGTVFVHKALGLGIVLGVWGPYTRCILAGRERSFVTDDFEGNAHVQFLQFAYGKRT